MNKYVFYTKEKDTQVLIKSSLTAQKVKALKLAGFKRHHQEVEAQSVKEAIEKLNLLNEEELSSLSLFSGNVIFSATLFIVIFVLVIFYL